MASAAWCSRTPPTWRPAFPDLWPTRDAAKKDAQRRGTNCYYRILYNSEMSPSSAVVSYRPEGAGRKLRSATFDLTIIPDPEAWLTARLGPTGDLRAGA